MPERKGAGMTETDNDKTTSLLHPLTYKLLGNLKSDQLVTNTLSGHLVMEELMTEIIGKFFWTDEFVDDLRLSFHQKMLLCRSISKDNRDERMWVLISKINKLRNDIAHYLDQKRRVKTVNEIRSTFSIGDTFNEEDHADLVLAVIGYCMGMLKALSDQAAS
jgi:hypothetical protein